METTGAGRYSRTRVNPTPSLADRSALDRLHEVFRWDPTTVRTRLSEWFYTYHADLYRHGVPFEVYVRKAQAIRNELGDARRILDVGSGFGVYACLLRILGIPEVVALDYHSEKPRVGRALAALLGLDGLRFLQGDALAFPFRPGTFDGAIALASLSHVREPEQAVANVAQVLRTGGRLYVFEDNNSSYPGYYTYTSPVWEGAETGCYATGVAPEKKVPESYLEMRRAMIRNHHPDLPAEAVEECARATRGLYGRRILKAVEEYRAGRPIENPRRHLACNPHSGEFEEYPLNPGLVKRMMKDAGFEPRLRSPHRGPFRKPRRWLKRITAAVLSLCPSLLRWMSPTFAVVGEKAESRSPVP